MPLHGQHLLQAPQRHKNCRLHHQTEFVQKSKFRLPGSHICRLRLALKPFHLCHTTRAHSELEASDANTQPASPHNDHGWGNTVADTEWVEDVRVTHQQPDVWGTTALCTAILACSVGAYMLTRPDMQRSTTSTASLAPQAVVLPQEGPQSSPSTSHAERPNAAPTAPGTTPGTIPGTTPSSASTTSPAEIQEQPVNSNLKKQQPPGVLPPESLLPDAWGDDGQWDTSPTASWRTAQPPEAFSWDAPVPAPNSLPPLPPFPPSSSLDLDLFPRHKGGDEPPTSLDLLHGPWLDLGPRQNELSPGQDAPGEPSTPSTRDADGAAPGAADEQLPTSRDAAAGQPSTSGVGQQPHSEPGSSDWGTGLQPPWTIRDSLADRPSTSGRPTAPQASQTTLDQPLNFFELFEHSSLGGPYTGPSRSAVPSPKQPGSPSPPLTQELPTMATEPLLRAVEPGVVSQLPQDRSLPSLRERAQIALRAASGAIEASARASAYSAAANSAASKAAEAAERAVHAAATAQLAVEEAADGAVLAAESRAARASELAAQAEERAASAAAMATAYQDVAQTQATISEAAADVPQPAAPAPSKPMAQDPSWLQNAWHGTPGRERLEHWWQLAAVHLGVLWHHMLEFFRLTGAHS